MSLARGLLRAFHATTYTATAATGERFALRIGRRHPALDAWLAARGQAAWAYVSACNPGARSLAPPLNVRRHAALLAELRERLPDGNVLDGFGVPDGPDWAAEPSVLVAGLPLAEARALARRHGQLALVHGRTGGRARLLDSGLPQP
ncbi:uncharacterized protein DUF3293 [Plasticicumulans lactativorans]|uniref:Uncharacterized protein DUF3293 n=1 Tax=Plasticicumulans lactativorans TaxID=1133106 RepID=A0A4R2L7X2_9GAMM|nr:DUF3293 domain-containing protein [Plasticicumulans lactativorans]TCO80259.1 uncharacterized protein DUF3293 [Plasticicumulans lactativorans]